MKIQHLKIKNIASIEEASIDFEHGPLADDPLFLITGDTGTGKTTILNAICLALYNDVPSSRTIGTSDEDREGLKTKHPLQLMRKGTVEAYVELRFIGNNDHSYLAKWMASRARKKVDGNLKLARELTDLSTQQSCKGKDIDKEIPVVVGLTFDQFTRTTMLAQGQFATFMKASDNDKSDILEKLTGTDIYSTIGLRINQLYKEKQSQFNVLEEVLKQAQLLSPEKKTELNTELITSDSKIKRCSARISTLSTQIQWLTQEASLRQQLQMFTEAVENSAKDLESDTFATNKDIINEWEDTREVRSWIDQKRDTEQSIANLSSQLDNDMKQELAKILSYQLSLAQKQTSLKKKQDELADKIKAEQHLLPIYDLSQKIGQKASTITSARLRRDNYAREISRLETQIAQANKAQEEQSATVEKIQADYNAQKEEVNKLENDLSALNVPSLSKEHHDTMQLLDDTRQSRADVAAYLAAVEKVAEAKKTLDESNNELTNTRAQIQQLEIKLPSAKAQSERKEAFLQGQMDLIDHIASMREKFAETSTCPLCGSHVDKLLGDEPLNEALQQARAAASEAKSTFDSLTQSRAELIATEKAQARDVKSKTKALETATDDLFTAENKLKDKEIDYQADNALTNLDSRIEELQTTVKDLSLRINDANELSNNLNDARKSLDSKQEQLSDAQKLLGEAKNKITNLQGNMTAQSQGRESSQKEINDTLADLLQLTHERTINENDWRSLVLETTGKGNLSEDTIAAFSTAILAKAEQYDKRSKSLTDISRECNELEDF